MDTFDIIGIVICCMLIIVFMPLAIIWALNTLFALSIAYTIKTWLAIFVICFVFNGNKVGSNNFKLKKD
jgi:hypothetical protein